MKKLIFIDNDDLRQAETDSNKLKRNLRTVGKLSVEYINSMAIIPDLFRMKKDELYDLVFSNDNCICTHSMYTATHFNSLGVTLMFLSTAGTASIKDMLYIDGSGMFMQDIGGAINDRKDAMYILNAIEANNIISFKDNEFFRIRIELKGVYESPFKREKINLKKLLS